jgi:hypothetical protein
MSDSIPVDILQSPVNGLHLSGATLAHEIGERPTLLVFLRHFGCPFCKEMVGDLRKVTDANKGYPPVLFFFQGTVDEGRAFFQEYWPRARAVADPQRDFYRAFDLRRATYSQLFGLRVWTCGVRAAAKGHFIGLPVGDPWLMPGVFLVHAGDIVWSHHFQHQGDHPDWATIVEKVPVAGSSEI